MPSADNVDTQAEALQKVRALYDSLQAVRRQMHQDGLFDTQCWPAVHTNFALSATNLLQYLSLRRVDLRTIQTQLSELGLSSLGRSESCILSSVDKLLGLLSLLLGESFEPAANELGHSMGSALLQVHSDQLLGRQPPERSVRIMVTMPSEAAEDGRIIYRLLKQGMDCMRINCAHDSPRQWLSMIQYLRQAEQTLGCSCKVLMDLAGPKLRTGPVMEGPKVVKVKPVRDTYGWPVQSARVWLTAKQNPCPAPSDAAAQLHVDSDWLNGLLGGDELALRDARGARRRWSVIEASPTGAWVEAQDTAYIAEGMLLSRSRDQLTTQVSGVPAKAQGIPLQLGSLLKVTASETPGLPAKWDASGRVLFPASIGCTLPEVLSQVRVGQSIWFDDGKIGGEIESVQGDHILVRINQVRLRGRVVKADKGINLPDSELSVPALTNKDLQDLEFVAQHADMVALSFVNKVKDVEWLKSRLVGIGDRQPGIVLKIETHQAFRNLPQLLFSAMGWPSCGVMIARGDLAVECGFERMAEVQEEILWLCEAAHVPVIWATQVLESLARDGLPSRAEISDAAMGNQSECVMLNKGPHIDKAVQVLDNILRRMQTHQHKKRSMMRRLHVAAIPSVAE